MKKIIMLIGIIGLAINTFGAGFGIYEASARGNALGGAIIGDVNDATANYHNPAKIADSERIKLALGATWINPYCDVEVNHKEQSKMNSGWFTVPTFYLTIPLPFDFTLGWGNYTEFGLGTKYACDWDLAKDSRKTTIWQMTFNPNLAYKITDWWNVSAGLRVSYIDFEGYTRPYYKTPGYKLESRIKGDDTSLGWNAATSFRVCEDVTLGLVYRSRMKHKMNGKAQFTGGVNGIPVSALYGMGMFPFSGFQSATGKITLPDSLVLGANWDVTEDFRMGSVITYTRWSSVEQIKFKTRTATIKEIQLHWHDTIRVGFGFEYDFTSWFTGRLGYTFDRDPTSSHYQSTMLPAGDRHIIGFGSGFHLTDNLSIDLSYNFIRMNNEHYYIHSSTSHDYVSNRNGYSHLIGATLTYTF